ncbi:AAA family ATPase [Methanogenium organophilum]|uniref:MoxR family ATPase n=1 Tax=Methanogenium organophilum TaxID=2199 RepID=A0A9X9T761_METOG|nr:MoxR family ATPase [Methanogenium organophilum]WAI00699.1 MoxR family ATPase [Methanogenium organophilum]
MTEFKNTRSITQISQNYTRMREEIRKMVVGNDDLIEMMIIAILSEGHILIEGVPGTAKTTLAKTCAILSGCDFNRFQCSVDSQPADVIGIQFWNPDDRKFELRKGPVFTNIFLIDEINRMSPKTQSAFIEALSEKQATIDGTGYELPNPFCAIATQNPMEFEGTFPLIEAQKDRFMFSVYATHLSGEEELEVVRREQDGTLNWKKFAETLSPLFSQEGILNDIQYVKTIHVGEEILAYIRDIVMATREHGDIALGSSTRGTIALLRGSRAKAALESRNYVIPDDVKKVAEKALQHRIILRREAEISGTNSIAVIRQILDSVEVP